MGFLNIREKKIYPGTRFVQKYVSDYHQHAKLNKKF